MSNLYDTLDKGTRTRFLTALGVNVSDTSEKGQREILADYSKDDVDEMSAHGFA